MTKKLSGSCLCGVVQYLVKDGFDAFYLCHCEQCQKVTGSGFAANILTTPDAISWVSGEDWLVNYEHPERAFSKAFCKVCGSGLPHINKSGKNLVIPAGSLDQPLNLSPEANLFVSESPVWLDIGLSAKKFRAFPNET